MKKLNLTLPTPDPEILASHLEDKLSRKESSDPLLWVLEGVVSTTRKAILTVSSLFIMIEPEKVGIPLSMTRPQPRQKNNP